MKKKKNKEERFVSLLYNKAILYDLEHSSALHGIGALLVIAIDWERHGPLFELINCGCNTPSW